MVDQQLDNPRIWNGCRDDRITHPPFKVVDIDLEFLDEIFADTQAAESRRRSEQALPLIIVGQFGRPFKDCLDPSEVIEVDRRNGVTLDTCIQIDLHNAPPFRAVDIRRRSRHLVSRTLERRLAKDVAMNREVRFLCEDEPNDFGIVREMQWCESVIGHGIYIGVVIQEPLHGFPWTEPRGLVQGSAAFSIELTDPGRIF